MLEHILQLYKDVCKVPTISRAWISVNNAGSKDVISVTSLWSQTDLVRNAETNFERSYTIDIGAKPLHSKILYRTNPVETVESCRNVSKSGLFTAVLRDIVPGKKSNSNKLPEKSQFLDIFSNELSIKENSVDLKSLEKHGKVDTGFCALNFSDGEGHLLYLAEKFRKPVAFFDPKFDDEKYLADPMADEFMRTESWGESLSTCKEPAICILDISSGNITVLDNVPEDISPIEPVWGPRDEGVCFVGLSNVPSKLGHVACFNRRSRLFYYSIKEASCCQLIEYEAAFKSLRFAPNCSKIIFLQSEIGGPHAKSEILKVVDWQSKTCKTIVDMVHSPKDDSFPGLFCTSVPSRCWAMDNERVILTTTWHSKTEIVVIDVETAHTVCITNRGHKYGSWQVLDVCQDFILAANSAPNRPPALLIARLPPKGQEVENLVWTKLDVDNPQSFDQLLSGIKWEVLKFQRPAVGSEPKEFSKVEFESLLYLPDEKNCSATMPLMAVPHGGPCSTSVAAWNRTLAFFVLSGYAILRVNYRGSLGFGENFVNALMGRVGSTDVLDCKHAIDVTLSNLLQQSGKGTVDLDNVRPVFLYGGSHGGFLTGHLIGQFPNFCRAAVAINPVLNLSSMLFESDIPDWVVVCGLGIQYDPTKVITQNQIATLLEKSPIFHVEQVKTPTMLAIGESDLRVPNAQIWQYARILKARGIPVKILSYPANNHRLGNVDAEASESINTILWFENYRTHKN